MAEQGSESCPLPLTPGAHGARGRGVALAGFLEERCLTH